ncbi:MAG: hypothetical protein RBQ94_03340 [Methanimicrococcus sp.]|nr:hypothetical protein [Methanimicrococcus sp.]
MSGGSSASAAPSGGTYQSGWTVVRPTIDPTMPDADFVDWYSFTSAELADYNSFKTAYSGKSPWDFNNEQV